MASVEYRAGPRKGFTVVYRSVAQDKRLSLKARGLFLFMQSLPDDWKFTQNGLAVAAGVGRAQIRAALKELEDCGYLIKKQSHDGAGKFAGAVYELREEAADFAPDDKQDFAENPREDITPLSENPITEKPMTENPTVNNNNINNNNKNKPPISPKGDGAGLDLLNLFERFWKAYPRKQKKQDALKAWKNLKPDLSLCLVMSKALKAQKKSEQWTRDQGRYIPLAGSWIRGKRWEDEPGPSADRNPDRRGPYDDIPDDDPRRGEWL